MSIVEGLPPEGANQTLRALNIGHWDYLLALHIITCSGLDISHAIANTPSLDQLMIFTSPLQKLGGWAALSQCNPDILRLEIHGAMFDSCCGCTALTEHDPFARCQLMEALRLDTCQITKLPSSGGSLRELRVSTCHELTDIRSLSSCTGLERLELKNCTTLVDLNPLSWCPALQELDMSWSCSVMDIPPLSGCTALRFVNMHGCTNVRDLSPLSHCAALDTVILSECSGITDVSPLASCPELHFADLRFCQSLVDVQPLTRCTKLVLLEIMGCHKITTLPENFSDVTTVKSSIPSRRSKRLRSQLV